MYQAIIGLPQNNMPFPQPHRAPAERPANTNIEGVIGFNMGGGDDYAAYEPFDARPDPPANPVVINPQPAAPAEPVAEPVVEGFATEDGRIPLSYFTDALKSFSSYFNLTEHYTVNQAFFLGCSLGSLDGAILGILFPRMMWNALMLFYILVFSVTLYIAGNVTVPPKVVPSVKYAFVFSIVMILTLGMKRLFSQT